MPLKNRLLHLFVAWLVTGIVYAGAGFVTTDARIVPESGIEQLIPFSAYGIWLYLSFYLYIPYTFVTADAARIRPLSAAFVVTAIVSGIFFVWLPTTIRFPESGTDGISARLLHFVSENDTPHNCFPSMHGSLITLCTLANLERSRKLRSIGCALLTLAMYCAIIQVRRHVFIDLAAGIVLALIVWPTAVLVFGKRNVVR